MEEEPDMKFDWTVNLGQVLTAAAMILSLVAAFFALKSDIRDHETRIVNTEKAIEAQQRTNQSTNHDLGEIKTGVAVIRDRLERTTTGVPGREVSPRQ